MAKAPRTKTNAQTVTAPETGPAAASTGSHEATAPRLDIPDGGSGAPASDTGADASAPVSIQSPAAATASGVASDPGETAAKGSHKAVTAGETARSPGYPVRSPVKHDGKRYRPDDPDADHIAASEISAAEAGALIAIGVLGEAID